MTKLNIDSGDIALLRTIKHQFHVALAVRANELFDIYSPTSTPEPVEVFGGINDGAVHFPSQGVVYKAIEHINGGVYVRNTPVQVLVDCVKTNTRGKQLEEYAVVTAFYELLERVKNGDTLKAYLDVGMLNEDCELLFLK